MKILIVSKEADQLVEACAPNETICCQTQEEAVQKAREGADTVLLDTSHGEIGSTELFCRLRTQAPGLIPVFLSDSPGQAMEAFRLGAADYLVRPFTPVQLENAIFRAKLLTGNQRGRIEIRTFGHFDLFVDNCPVAFSRQRSKEILAYLVDRMGGVATNQQILTDLWEEESCEKNAKNSFQTAFKTLRADLAQVGADGILCSARNQKWLDIRDVECDYYRLLQGDEEALRTFPGQYMAEYSWAELSNANCIRLKAQYEAAQLEKKKDL